MPGGDNSSQEAHQRTEVVDRLCETLGQHGWNILRDSNVLRSGELISGFMKRIGVADHVIVVLSDKYLRSPYCMTELHYIYQRSLGEKEDFLRRIIPLVLDDAGSALGAIASLTPNTGKRSSRLWRRNSGTSPRQTSGSTRRCRSGHNRIGDMLAYVNDVLTPHGFEEIIKDDFAAFAQDAIATSPDHWLN